MNLRYLVDTDWVIDYLNGRREIVRKLSEFQAEGIGLSVVSLAELWEGVVYSIDPEGNQAHLRNFLRGVRPIGIDEQTCRIFGKERGRLRARKKSLGDFDLLIGATALRHGLVLLTNNRRHFELIEGLQLWLSARM